MNFIERYRDKFEGLSRKEQLGVTFYLIVLASLIVTLALTIADNMPFFDAGTFTDVHNYFENINDVVERHLIPYKEAPLEYPPFTLVIFLIPRIFSGGSWGVYQLLFNLFAAFSYCLFLYLSYRIFERFSKDRYSLVVYVLLIILTCNVMIFNRNDVFAITFITAGFYFFLKDRQWLAAIMIACAAMIKIYPVILVPVFMIIFISRKDWKNTVLFAVVSGLACLLMELPFLIMDPSTAFSWVSYHSERGLQAEGIVSSFVMMIDYVFPCIDDISPDESKSISLHGYLPNQIASVMDYILIAMMAVALLMILVRTWKARDSIEEDRLKTLSMSALIMVMTFITFSKVYSAQYSQWILTLIPFFIPAKGVNRKFYIAVCVFMLTSVVSQAVAFGVSGANAVWIKPIIFAKNVAHLFLFYLLIKMFWEHTSVGKAPAVQGGAIDG